MKAIICSAADAKYWSLLSGLLNSIEQPAKRAGFSFGVLDLGLTPEQKARLDRFGATTVVPDWDYDIAHLETPPRYLLAMSARPHLRKYFPGYDLIVWLDADCWVQDWLSVILLAESAVANTFSIIPEVDRSYSPFFADGSVLEWLLGSYTTCFGEAEARQMILYPYLNCGVFAATKDAPHWASWAKYLGDVVKRLSRQWDFYAEQNALNAAVIKEKLRIARLPSTCNWLCNRSRPRCTNDGKIFLETAPPFQKLGILHLTSTTKEGLWSVFDLSGKEHKMSLAHPPLDMS